MLNDPAWKPALGANSGKASAVSSVSAAGFMTAAYCEGRRNRSCDHRRWRSRWCTLTADSYWGA
jgi:hypothetical protein